MKYALLSALALSFSIPLQAQAIDWQPSFDACLEAAKASEHVVFIAVNMDGEAANERMVSAVYEDKAVQALAVRTLSLVASNNAHPRSSRECRRFGSVTCDEHRRIDAEVRERVLKPDEDGFVVAPQHVFLSPDGDVLLSVPYELTASELEWCFVAALRLVDPELELEPSRDARAPRRLILGGVFDGAGGEERLPLTPEAVVDLVDQIKRGLRGGERWQALRRLATADHPLALRTILDELRQGAGGGRRGGGGGAEQLILKKTNMLRWIGRVSPESYWAVCVELLGDADDAVRQTAVVALEQLAARDSIGPLQKALRKEKEPLIEKDILRALGAAGSEDKGVGKLLRKKADDKDARTRANALIALASRALDDELAELFVGRFREGQPRDREAAVIAMGLTRDERFLELLQAALEELDPAESEPAGKEPGEEPEDEPEGPPVVRLDLRATLSAAVKVLNEGNLAPLEGPLRRIAEDDVRRERLFEAK